MFHLRLSKSSDITACIQHFLSLYYTRFQKTSQPKTAQSLLNCAFCTFSKKEITRIWINFQLLAIISSTITTQRSEKRKKIAGNEEIIMKTNLKLRNSLLLILTALIWGIAFVAQSEGGDAVGPYTFNCIRFLIGAVVLIPLIAVLDKKHFFKKDLSDRTNRKNLLTGGIACGLVLCIASNLQQLGLYFGASAGKAGFLTACYILLVPVLGLFMKKRCSWNIWLGVGLTLIGLYLLCVKESLSFQFSDLLLLACAFCFAIHILVIEHFSPLVDGVKMSCIQFFAAGLLSAVPMCISDISSAGVSAWIGAFGNADAWIPILYAGIFSCGVAYTLQIIGQNGLNSTVASLLMSLESVFSVLAGWFLLHETMSSKELLGCALIFTAVILAQIPVKSAEKSQA